MVMSPVIEREAIKFKEDGDLVLEELKFWHEFNDLRAAKLVVPILKVDFMKI